MNDLARRFEANPILKPVDLQPSAAGMEVECLLNPGVFRYDRRIGLLLRVAERPRQKPGKISLSAWGNGAGMRFLEFDRADPDLDVSDARIISYKGQSYLTTLSHLRLVWSDDG